MNANTNKGYEQGLYRWWTIDVFQHREERVGEIIHRQTIVAILGVRQQRGRTQKK